MWRSNAYYVIYIGLICCLEPIKSSTINDSNVLLHDLLEGYNTNVRPIADQTKPVDVSVQLLLKSLQGLDEIHGIFTIFAGLMLTWNDAKIIWNPETYGGINRVHISYESVWVPELIIVSPAEEVDSFGKKWQKVSYDSTGFAFWAVGDLIKISYAVNMRNYPFDNQTCMVTFSTWSYYSDEIKLNSTQASIVTDFYEENSVWELEGTKSEAVGNTVVFTFYIQRKSGFIIVDVILPLTFLSLLNAFASPLSSDSGERVSYCITVLLSIAVFMTIVSETLPRSSEPVPRISYKLLFDLMLSALITLSTMFNMRLYSNTSPVPRWLQKIYLRLNCKYKRYRVSPNNSNNNPCSKDEKQINLPEKEENAMKHVIDVNPEVTSLEGLDEIHKVSWRQIGQMSDNVAFVVTALASVMSFTLFMISSQ